MNQAIAIGAFTTFHRSKQRQVASRPQEKTCDGAFFVVSPTARTKTRRMKPEEIIALRKALRCTPHELGEALGLDAKTVMAWEQEQLFPTKRYVERMKALLEAGPGSVPRRRRGTKKARSPFEVLAEPRLWSVVRKLVAHPELLDQVEQLAERYDEP